MAKESSEKKPTTSGDKGSKSSKAKKLHLHSIRTERAADGSLVHHHTYKESPDAHYAMPERGPMATSATPEEAGQHVADQFGMSGGGAEPDGDEGQGQAQPAAGSEDVGAE